MGERVIVTEEEDRPKPDTIIVVPQEKPKPEKEVVVTETTRVTTEKE